MIILLNDLVIKAEETLTDVDMYVWKPNRVSMEYSWQHYETCSREELEDLIERATEVYDAKLHTT